MSKLVIKNLHVSVENKEILKGINLELDSSEKVALLGPNGNGKSTLFAAIMGNPRYVVTEGEILLDGKDLLKMTVDERSKAGIFLGFQNPAEISGVICADFYKAALNARSEKKVSLYKFYKSLENSCKEVEMPMELVNRSLNDGFSGGEKKRNEILQMKLLNPTFAMLDEIDSGLDVDAINLVGKAINDQYKLGTGFIIISHYSRLFDLVQPTKTVVLIDGKIAVVGGQEVYKRIDKEGFEWIRNELHVEFKKDESMNKVSLGACATKEVIKNEGK